MKFFRLASLLWVFAIALASGIASPAFAETAEESSASEEPILEGPRGTSHQGQSGTFEQFVNDAKAPKDEQIELMKVDEDSRVTLGSEDDEDLEAAMRMSY